MSDDQKAKIRKAKSRQRKIFYLGASAALLPIICQLIIGLVIASSGQDFPKSDNTLKSLHFWEIQVVLLCVAIAGNTLVDFAKHVIDKTAKTPGVVLRVWLLGGVFLVISIFFSVSMLGTDVLSRFAIPLMILSVLDIYIAYVVDMDLAMIDAGLMSEED